MTTDWAQARVGGLTDWCWVFELQDRGAPHTHFCLEEVTPAIGSRSCSDLQKNTPAVCS
jgi:hypothetical protein